MPVEFSQLLIYDLPPSPCCSQENNFNGKILKQIISVNIVDILGVELHYICCYQLRKSGLMLISIVQLRMSENVSQSHYKSYLSYSLKSAQRGRYSGQNYCRIQNFNHCEYFASTRPESVAGRGWLVDDQITPTELRDISGDLSGLSLVAAPASQPAQHGRWK